MKDSEAREAIKTLREDLAGELLNNNLENLDCYLNNNKHFIPTDRLNNLEDLINGNPMREFSGLIDQVSYLNREIKQLQETQRELIHYLDLEWHKEPEKSYWRKRQKEKKV